MKLDYATIISPCPVILHNIGRIRAPTLKEIWDPSVTYDRYQMYLSLLLATPQGYADQAAPQPESHGTSPESASMFDIISRDSQLQELYREVFNFFLEENVIWNDDKDVFITYSNENERLTGVIHRDIYSELCNIILQRCGLTVSDYPHDPSKVRNRRSREIMEKINAGRSSLSRHRSADQDMELPNIIAAVAVHSNSLNFTNIWDLTVCQLYEQFRREQNNVYFDIQKMSVAAYGNEKKLFKGNEWFRLERNE